MNAAHSLGRPASSRLDRLVYAVGNALIEWSTRSGRCRPIEMSTRDRELHVLRRAAQLESAQIIAQRDLGAHRRFTDVHADRPRRW